MSKHEVAASEYDDLVPFVSGGARGVATVAIVIVDFFCKKVQKIDCENS